MMMFLPAGVRYRMSMRPAFFGSELGVQFCEFLHYSLLDPLVRRRALPGGVEQPQVIEEMLLDVLLLGIGIHQASERADHADAAPCDLAVLDRLDLIDARERPSDDLELQRAAVEFVYFAQKVAQSQLLEGEDGRFAAVVAKDRETGEEQRFPAAAAFV